MARLPTHPVPDQTDSAACASQHCIAYRRLDPSPPCAGSLNHNSHYLRPDPQGLIESLPLSTQHPPAAASLVVTVAEDAAQSV